MAEEFDNSFERFARPVSGLGYNLVAAGALLLPAATLAVGLVAGNWTIVAAAILTIAAVAGLLMLAAGRYRRSIGERAAAWIAWEPAFPDVQRQSLNVSVGELSRILKVEPEAVSELRSAFIVAEDLALRQIQQEENAPLLRHVSVGGVPFDAAFTKDTLLVCCEVCFLVAPELGQDKIVAMMRKIAAVKRSIAEMNIGLDVRLMVILVTQMSAADVEKLRGTLSTKRFTATPVDIDIRLLDFEGLQKVYVTE